MTLHGHWCANDVPFDNIGLSVYHSVQNMIFFFLENNITPQHYTIGIYDVPICDIGFSIYFTTMYKMWSVVENNITVYITIGIYDAPICDI